MPTIIHKCDTCKKDTLASGFQDERYGFKQRVFNFIKRVKQKQDEKRSIYKCTVCSGTIEVKE